MTSPTALGNFNEWVVDFRPISSSQVSAKNELDCINDIFMGFLLQNTIANTKWPLEMAADLLDNRGSLTCSLIV